MDVIAGIQTALDITGKLRELSKKIQDADFSMLLADLTMQLADTKLSLPLKLGKMGLNKPRKQGCLELDMGRGCAKLQ